MPDVDAEFERSGRHQHLQLPGAQLLSGGEPRFFRETAVMRGDELLADVLERPINLVSDPTLTTALGVCRIATAVLGWPAPEKFEREQTVRLAHDVDGNPVYLAPNKYNLQVTMQAWPAVHFLSTREHGEILG